jgi:hypothetical protein
MLEQAIAVIMNSFAKSKRRDDRLFRAMSTVVQAVPPPDFDAQVLVVRNFLHKCHTRLVRTIYVVRTCFVPHHHVYYLFCVCILGT